jgi:S1-C subfamily serine protease
VTNEHVVRDAERLTVILSDGTEFTAVGWVRDATTDLAVVQIDPDRELPYAHFLSNSLGRLELVEEVVAVGNALALPGGPTWTKGVVSHLGRPIQVTGGGVLEDLIQTDAAINPGNSGGPLVNMAGQVVGINTAVAEGVENIGFAISTDTAIPVINSLVTEGFVSVAYLGVKMISVTPAVQSDYDLSVDSGAFILEVVSGSPAALAGLRAEDVVIRFGDTDIDDVDQLKVAIVEREIGDTVEITYVRGQSTFTTEATLVQRPT